MLRRREIPPTPPEMLITTTDTLPWAYRPLGLVLTDDQHLFNAGGMNTIKKLRKEAEKLGARAVIGVRIAMAENKSTIAVTAYGTAVTWDDPQA